MELAPLQAGVLKGYCDLVPGVPELVAELRRWQIKIASTTGFESSMIADLITSATRDGYSPDVWVCPDRVGKGRPAPWMIYYAAREMEVYPLRTFVKVGDTPADVAEGHAAGVWVVSVVRSGRGRLFRGGTGRLAGCGTRSRRCRRLRQTGRLRSALPD